MPKDTIEINRAPVLTLWAAVVEERLGLSRDEALSLGKAVAGLNAQAKGRSLGIFEAKRETVREAEQRKRGEEFWVKLCGRPVPAKNTDEGVRAVSRDTPITSDSVAKHLGQKFGDGLNSAKEAMQALAKAFEPDDLAERAYALYETFCPEIPAARQAGARRARSTAGPCAPGPTPAFSCRRLEVEFSFSRAVRLPLDRRIRSTWKREVLDHTPGPNRGLQAPACPCCRPLEASVLSASADR
jgi:hypothetical protein